MDDIIQAVQEKVYATQCNPGDIVTGWVMQSESVLSLIESTAHSVAEAVRAEAYQRGFDAGMEVAEEQHTGRIISPTQEK